LEIPTGTKEAARLHQRGSLKGTDWFTRYPRTEPMVSVCGCRLENRYLRPCSTGAEVLFSSSVGSRPTRFSNLFPANFYKFVSRQFLPNLFPTSGSREFSHIKLARN